MATINLTDQFGLDISVDPGPFSVFRKYLKNPREVPLVLKSETTIQDVTIGNYPFRSQSLGLSFQQPVDLGTTGVELRLKPSVSGSLAVEAGKNLLGSVLYDLPGSQSLLQQTYLSAALEASLAGVVADQPGSLQFASRLAVMWTGHGSNPSAG